MSGDIVVYYSATDPYPNEASHDEKVKLDNNEHMLMESSKVITVLNSKTKRLKGNYYLGIEAVSSCSVDIMVQYTQPSFTIGKAYPLFGMKSQERTVPAMSQFLKDNSFDEYIIFLAEKPSDRKSFMIKLNKLEGFVVVCAKQQTKDFQKIADCKDFSSTGVIIFNKDQLQLNEGNVHIMVRSLTLQEGAPYSQTLGILNLKYTVEIELVDDVYSLTSTTPYYGVLQKEPKFIAYSFDYNERTKFSGIIFESKDSVDVNKSSKLQVEVSLDRNNSKLSKTDNSVTVTSEYGTVMFDKEELKRFCTPKKDGDTKSNGKKSTPSKNEIFSYLCVAYIKVSFPEPDQTDYIIFRVTAFNSH